MCYWIFRAILAAIFKIFFRLKIEGLENLPKKGNYIVVANHVSYLDALVLGVAMPQKIYWIALRDLYKLASMRWFLKLTDTLPSGNSSQTAVKLLSEDNCIGLFPEGAVSRDGKLKDFRRGAAMLALRTGRPIVPCLVIGTYEAYPFGAVIPKLIPLKVKIARPVYLLKEFDEIIDDANMQHGITRVRNIIEEMYYA